MHEVVDIGRDFFSSNRIYVKIEDLPKKVLSEIKEKDKVCGDCGGEPKYLVINLNKITCNTHIKLDGYLNCGHCAVGW